MADKESNEIIDHNSDGDQQMDPDALSLVEGAGLPNGEESLLHGFWTASGDPTGPASLVGNLHEADSEIEDVDVLGVVFNFKVLRTMRFETNQQIVEFVRARAPDRCRDLDDAALLRLVQQHARSILPHPNTPPRTIVHTDRAKTKNRRSGLKYKTKKMKLQKSETERALSASEEDYITTVATGGKRDDDPDKNGDGVEDMDGGGNSGVSV